MSDAPTTDELLARYVAAEESGGAPTAEQLCADCPERLPGLQAAIARYREVDGWLDGVRPEPDERAEPAAALPQFDGFRTIERIGRGGMGEVYKLEDLELGRTVAAKTLRSDAAHRASVDAFLHEAVSLALFQDPRIVRLYELRADADPPVLIMEHVEGFELHRLAPSLEIGQRARIVAEICEAIHHAHTLGLQHRDLKPSNVLLDERLQPKVLDFGLAGTDPHRGHGFGTLPYVAPEQLDPSRPIDHRADVYALGVLLYELLCGRPPYVGDDDAAVIAEIEQGHPRLPIEIDPDCPEPLQAIALKAMESAPRDRYPSAREMALDLRRWLAGRPVWARPSHYATALGRRLRPHLEQVEDWLQLKLIYPHEARRLRSAYRRLESREDDWIVESRRLSYSQIALYLGAFLLACGSLLYFAAHRFFGAVEGWLGPLVVLGAPFVGLNLAADHLYRRRHEAVAVAFHLGGVVVLPLLLALLMVEAGIGTVPPETAGQLFVDGEISNRQLQLASLVGAAWAIALAVRTRTTGLASVACAMIVLTALALLTDRGLGRWLEDGLYDRLALHLAPLVLVCAVAGRWMEARRSRWFGVPLYLTAVGLLVAVLELVAWNGRAFHYLGLSMARFQSEEVAEPLLLDSLTAMTLNGLAFYLVGVLIERLGTAWMRPGAWLLFTLSPFAVLQPIAYLNWTEDYAAGFLWFYLALALAVVFFSQHRQRKSFYFAGLGNAGLALLLITDRYDWYDVPWWAKGIVTGGVLLLVAGFLLDLLDRRRSAVR